MSPDPPITVGDWLRSASRRLLTARPEGALEARLLLQAVLTAPPAHLFARPERVLSADEATRPPDRFLQTLVVERLHDIVDSSELECLERMLVVRSHQHGCRHFRRAQFAKHIEHHLHTKDARRYVPVMALKFLLQYINSLFFFRR